MRVWKRLPEWEDAAPLPPPSSLPVAEAEARFAACRHAAAARRAAAGPGGLRRSSRSRLRAARNPRRSAPGAGGGRHRHRARPSAISPPPACGPRRTTAACGSAPSPAICSARSTPNSSHLFPIRRTATGAWWSARVAENYLCLLNLEDALGPAIVATGARLGHPARPGRPLGAGDRRRRHPGRRPARLVCRTVRHHDDPRSRRSARRVHPCRLPALAPLLRRAHDPPRPHRAACRRQPCAGDDPGRVGRVRRQRRAHPLRVRRGPPRVRRRGQRVLRPALRIGNRRTAPLAARRRRRAIARPWPEAARRGTGRGAVRCWRRRWTPPCWRRARCLRRAGPAGLARIIRNCWRDWMPADRIRPRRSCG